MKKCEKHTTNLCLGIHSKLWPDMFVVTGLRAFTYESGDFNPIGGLSDIPLDRHLFYGVTWSEKDCYMNSSRSILKFTKVDSLVNLTTMQIYEDRHNGGHQILYHDGNIIFCNDGRNSLDFFDPETELIKKRIYFYPGYKVFENLERNEYTFDQFDLQWMKQQTDNNVIHVNSVFIDEKDRIFVCCHNKKKPSYCYMLENNKAHRIELMGNECHNVYVENNILYSLSSKETSIIECDLDDKSINKIYLELGEFGLDEDLCYLRGLAISEDYFIIGVARFNHARDNRDAGVSCLLMLDRQYNFIDFKLLPATGQIREVRLLQGDKAHNGIDFPKKFKFTGLQEKEMIDEQ